MLLLICPYFNSIKVQLELIRFVTTIICTDKFQFHKGTIRTPKPRVNKGSSTGFQFHKGTIRTQLPLFYGNMSTKFQFHKGTIRTTIRWLLRCFDFISIP